MAEALIELAIRLFNAALGALLGWGMFGGRHAFLGRYFGIDLQTRLLMGTIVGASIGLIWGKRIWAHIDNKIDGGWTGRGP